VQLFSCKPQYYAFSPQLLEETVKTVVIIIGFRTLNSEEPEEQGWNVFDDWMKSL